MAVDRDDDDREPLRDRIRWGNVAWTAAALAAVALVVAWPRLHARPPDLPPASPRVDRPPASTPPPTIAPPPATSTGPNGRRPPAAAPPPPTRRAARRRRSTRRVQRAERRVKRRRVRPATSRT